MRWSLLQISLILLLVPVVVSAQQDKRAFLYEGVVYDEHFRPLPYTHVISKGTGTGDMTDTLGIFKIYIRENDILSFYNITCRDTSVRVSITDELFYIKLKHKRYRLKEAVIFSWGSSYDDLLNETRRTASQYSSSLGEKLNLPQQDDNIVPLEQNEEVIESPEFLIQSPVSFFYYNYSKHEKSKRRAFKLKRDKELIDRFESLVSRQHLAEISSLQGEALEDFIMYVNRELSCDYHCDEISLLSELYSLWEAYKNSMNGEY